MLSLLYLVSYLGLGVPAVIGGVLVTEVNGLLATVREYGSAVVVPAALALAGLLVHRPPRRPWRASPPQPLPLLPGGPIAAAVTPGCTAPQTKQIWRSSLRLAAPAGTSGRDRQQATGPATAGRPSATPRATQQPRDPSRPEGFSPCP